MELRQFVARCIFTILRPRDHQWFYITPVKPEEMTERFEGVIDAILGSLQADTAESSQYEDWAYETWVSEVKAIDDTLDDARLAEWEGDFRVWCDVFHELAYGVNCALAKLCNVQDSDDLDIYRQLCGKYVWGADFDCEGASCAGDPVL